MEIMEATQAPDIKTGSSSKKGDILCSGPQELLRLAMGGEVTFEELQKALISIAKPGEIEKGVILRMRDVCALAMAIIEHGAEKIEMNSHGYDDIIENLPSLDEIVRKEYSETRERMESYAFQEVELINPQFLEKGDVVLVNFLYKKEEEPVPFDMILCVNRAHSHKVSGNCYLWTSSDGERLVRETFSLSTTNPYPDIISWKLDRSVNIFEDGVFFRLPGVFKSGLHERRIVKMQLFTEKQRKLPEEWILSRLLKKRSRIA